MNLLNSSAANSSTAGASRSEAYSTAVAIAVSAICVLIPVQMASQNWDDHDRSNRYSCRDFGANYLKSCDKEGIIFSNGDNDTFPLWYNQEVEEVGTDLRVCNLSYLQTDWYISQMKRPYYDSPALPITWEYKDFMPGANEVAWVADRVKEPMSVADAFAYLRSDDKRTKRDGENVLPTGKLYVETPDGGQIKIKEQRRYTRSEMMILEMLQQNQFQRPMYFACTVGGDYYLGLEPYFELCGLAYRITPTRSADGRPRVNTEVMYENMMHKFAYGNMNVPGIYIDENLMRMCRTHRMMFSQLAEALINENQFDRAKEVLDYAEEMLPVCNVPYDFTSATMASMYYTIGERDRAHEMMEIVANNNREYLEWGASLSSADRKACQNTIGHHAAVLGYVIQTAERNRDRELVEKYYPIYAQYAR